MEITKNLRIEAEKQEFIVLNVDYYLNRNLSFYAIGQEILKIKQVKSVLENNILDIRLTLYNYDQSTIDNVLLDIDFVLTEMLNEK